MDNIDLFVKNLTTKHNMVPINSHDIAELEAKLAVTLPDSFTYLLSTYGLVHTPNVLSKTCALGVDISEVQDFLNLEDIASLSQLYEMTGMPKGHVLFASDNKGNMFCFKTAHCQSKQQDSGVWYFDRELATVKQVSTSFTKWLNHFNDLQT